MTLKQGEIEVRDYPPLVTAQVETTGDRRAAGNAGFRLLARYDAPWTPWFLRRNEVMIPIKAVKSP